MHDCLCMLITSYLVRNFAIYLQIASLIDVLHEAQRRTTGKLAQVSSDSKFGGAIQFSM